VESSWQPQDYLPDAFADEVHEVRARAAEIPDEIPASGDDGRAPAAGGLLPLTARTPRGASGWR
jgi:hypothetical protein